MPYGHADKHPLAAFLGDLDALDWVTERIRVLRKNDTQLDKLARECDVVLARIDPRPEMGSEEAARLLLEFRALSDDEWQAFRRYTFALLTESPSNHGPS